MNKQKLALIAGVTLLLLAIVLIVARPQEKTPFEAYTEQERPYILRSNELKTAKDSATYILTQDIRTWLVANKNYTENQNIIASLDDTFKKTGMPADKIPTFSISLSEQAKSSQEDLKSLLTIASAASEGVVPTANASGDKNSQGESFIAIPTITGTSTMDRLQSFVADIQPKLSKEDVQSVVNLAETNKIDPVLPFCMAFADSQIGTAGKAVKTNNPCNYAHDDSGNTTYEFENMKTGMMKCVTHLVSPIYKNTKLIGDLSLGGRKVVVGSEWNKGYAQLASIGKMWWASSEENWNKNVTRCMSAVYGTTITEWYQFRK